MCHTAPHRATRLQYSSATNLPGNVDPELGARLLLEHARVAALVADDPADDGRGQVSHRPIPPDLLRVFGVGDNFYRHHSIIRTAAMHGRMDGRWRR